MMRTKMLLPLAVAATALAAAGPAAAAKSPHPTRYDKKQNAAIKKVATSTSKAGKSAKAANLAAAKVAKDLGAAAGSLKSTGDGLAAIQAAVPAVLDGLTKLKDGLTQVGDGLKSLQALATSTEYGIGQVFIAGAPASGSFVVTPDIPDAVQQAQATDTFIASATGAITVMVGVRSAESDGTGSTDPAASCRVTVVSGTNAGSSTPNAALGGAPFWPIALKSAQTSTAPADAGFPFGPIASDHLYNLTDTSGTPNFANVPAAPTANAGAPYTVTLSCVDTTPSTTDPTA